MTEQYVADPVVDRSAEPILVREHAAAPSPSFWSGLHRWLGGFPTAFFTLALVTDYAYSKSGTLQWSYFSVWLITAALIMGGIAIVVGIIDWATGGARGRRGVGLHFGLTALAWLVGLINAFVHSRDGWAAVVPTGILLSLLTVILLYAGGLIAGLASRPRTGTMEARA